MGGLDLLSSLLKILVVFGLLYLTMKGLARHQRSKAGLSSSNSSSTAPVIEVVDQARLGRSANLAAVRVGERVLLLGVTDGKIESLADVSGEVGLELDESETGRTREQQTSVLDHALDVLKSGQFRGPGTGD